jgi:hypothetical protein
MSLASERYAIELELTAKSSTRYRQILASYQVSSHYDRVLYVVGCPQIAIKIRRFLGDQIAVSATLPATVGRFTFKMLEDYFCEPKCTETLEKFTNNKYSGEKLDEK